MFCSALKRGRLSTKTSASQRVLDRWVNHGIVQRLDYLYTCAAHIYFRSLYRALSYSECLAQMQLPRSEKENVGGRYRIFHVTKSAVE